VNPVLIKFVCRRLRISEEKLRLKLRRMHSLLQISDSSIATYHRSLHDFLLDKKRAGKYRIHPARVSLVQLPERLRRFAARLGSRTIWALVLRFLYLVLMFLLFIVVISLVPLGIIFALCFSLSTWSMDNFLIAAVYIMLVPYMIIESI